MLHQVPDSAFRTRLLEVVEMQGSLIAALCSLPARSSVDLAWLSSTWANITDVDWLREFWENDKGARSKWCGIIAAAPKTVKRTILAIRDEQLRFAELYLNPPTARLQSHDWKVTKAARGAAKTRLEVMEALQNLLEAFYAPIFYERSGFPNGDGTFFHKGHFIGSPPTVCPYTDTTFQDPKLDHFLPKHKFPILSCHPDNLIPCSTDSNSGGHKGTKTPLDISASDQAGNWFHPRWRSARNTYRLEFPSGPSPQPTIRFVALQTQNQPRLDNLERMFGLSDFWGKFLDDELQNVAGDVDGLLSVDGTAPTEANVKAKLILLANLKRKKIGKDDLAIVKSAFYDHIAQDQTLLSQVLRTCSQGT
jgi:hypothetical protein